MPTICSRASPFACASVGPVCTPDPLPTVALLRDAAGTRVGAMLISLTQSMPTNLTQRRRNLFWKSSADSPNAGPFLALEEFMEARLLQHRCRSFVSLHRLGFVAMCPGSGAPMRVCARRRWEWGGFHVQNLHRVDIPQTVCHRRPIDPATTKQMQTSRSGEAVSPKNAIPSTATPTEPMPVQMA